MGSLGVLGAQSAAYTTNDWLGSDAYDRNGNTLWSTNGTTVLGRTDTTWQPADELQQRVRGV